jgi:glycosidase
MKRTRRALDELQRVLSRKARTSAGKRFRYVVPALWHSARGRGRLERVNPYAYYLDAINAIKRSPPARKHRPSGGEWTKDAVIYNMFVRTTTAVDHNRNGTLDLPVNAEGFRETGTFLKAIAMLPYIKRLGANTVHLLPVTAIGHDGNKGSLGSPYAIRNPYELDENLAEPALGLDVKTEFKAFVEAAHRLGLRVVVEFVFRTAAKDSDWVKEHPDWMYWILDDVQPRRPGELDEGKYGSPVFTREELDRIHADVNSGRFDNLVPPHPQYRAFFTTPPDPQTIRKVEGRYVGTLKDGRNVRIPGAFADWPPDDTQPPWGDVTYLRMYDHPEFNYIAYNTIRMYDARLAREEHVNRPLWDRIVGIIPYYQKEFAIDGVMIDMGHALPMALKGEMVAKARALNHDFAFWDENFSITARSREEGYNAVFGFLWIDQHHADRTKNLSRRLAGEGFPIPFFATPESHNTPRAAARPGGLAYAKWAVAVNAFLPAVPFIHSGYELGEQFPINTGLDFTAEELRRFPSETLPLFSAHAYAWDSRDEFTPWVRKVLAIRFRYRDLVVDPHPSSFRLLEDAHPSVLAFARLGHTGRKRLAVVSSMNFSGKESVTISLDTARRHCVDALSGHPLAIRDGALHMTLHPGQCVVFEY